MRPSAHPCTHCSWTISTLCHSKGPGVARGLVDRKYVGTARGALRAKSQLPSSCASGALGLSICDKPFPNSILLRLRRTRRPSGCALRARHARGDVPVNRRVVKSEV